MPKPPWFLEPFVAAFADLACGTGDGGYGYGGGGLEGEEAVVEVVEEEDFTVGGGEEGRLVDTVEGAGFEFTYSVCACVSVGRFRGKEQGQEKGRGGERREGLRERKTERRRKEKRRKEGWKRGRRQKRRVKGRRRKGRMHPLPIRAVPLDHTPRKTQCPPHPSSPFPMPVALSLTATTRHVPFARHGFPTTSFGFVPCSVDMKSTNLWTCLRAHINQTPGTNVGTTHGSSHHVENGSR